MSDNFSIISNVSNISNASNITDTTMTGLTPTQAMILRLMAIIMTVCFPLGLIVNIFALITLCRENTNNATENIFIGLTFADTLTNLSGIFTNLCVLLTYYTALGTYPFFTQNFKYLVRSDIVIYMAAFTISTTLSIERIFAVFKPTDFRKIWTPRCGIITVITGFSCTIFISLLIVTLLNEDALLLFRVVFTITCVAVALFSNMFVIYGLKTNTSKIAPSRGGGGGDIMARERRQTKILLIISLLFVICGSTTIAVALVGMLDSHNFEVNDFLVYIYGYIRWFFQVIYSVLNSLIFVAYNKNYRKRFIKTISCRC